MRRHSDILFEHLTEIQGILKTYLVGNLFNRISALGKEFFCLVYAEIGYIILEILTRITLKYTAEMRRAYAEIFT